MKKLLSVILINLFLVTLMTIASCSDEGEDYYYKEETPSTLFLLYADGQSDLESNVLNNISQLRRALSVMRADNENPAEGYGPVVVLCLYSGLKDATKPAGSQKGARLFEVKQIDKIGKERSIVQPWVNDTLFMGMESTLEKFLTYARVHYKADRTVLILSNHGSGPLDEKYTTAKSSTRSRTLCSGTGDVSNSEYLTTNGLSCLDIKSALENSGYTGSKTIDLLWEDCCLQSACEIVYDLKGCAKYFLSSSNISFPYDYFLAFREWKGSRSIGDNAIAMVDSYFTNLMMTGMTALGEEGSSEGESSGSFLATQTLVKLSDVAGLDYLKSKVNEVATKLLSAGESQKTTRPNDTDLDRARKLLLPNVGICFKGPYAYMTDLSVFATSLINDIEREADGSKKLDLNGNTIPFIKDEEIKSAAADLVGALERVIVYRRGESKKTAEKTSDIYDNNLINQISGSGLSITATYRGYKNPSNNWFLGAALNKDADYGGGIAEDADVIAASNDKYKDFSNFSAGNKWADLIVKLFGDNGLAWDLKTLSVGMETQEEIVTPTWE